MSINNYLLDVENLIGKNLLAFQSIELLLMHIHISSSGNGTQKELNLRNKKIKKSSFGDLVNQANIKRLNQSESNSTVDANYQYNFLDQNDILNDVIHKLKKLASRRNKFIHKLQLEFNLKSDEGLLKAKKNLLDQLEYLLPLKEQLKMIAQSIDTNRKTTLEIMASEGYLEAIEKAMKENNIRQMSNIGFEISVHN